MSLSNVQIQKRIKEKNKSLEEAINNVEVYLIHESSKDMELAVFWLGRAQSLYVEFQDLLKNQKIL